MDVIIVRGFVKWVKMLWFKLEEIKKGLKSDCFLVCLWFLSVRFLKIFKGFWWDIKILYVERFIEKFFCYIDKFFSWLNNNRGEKEVLLKVKCYNFLGVFFLNK